MSVRLRRSRLNGFKGGRDAAVAVSPEEGKTPTGGWKIQARHMATMRERPKDGWRLTPLPLALGEAATLFQAKCRYVRDTALPCAAHSMLRLFDPTITNGRPPTAAFRTLFQFCLQSLSLITPPPPPPLQLLPPPAASACCSSLRSHGVTP